MRPRLNKNTVVNLQGYADDEGTGILTSVGQNTPPPSPKAAAEDHGFAADDDKERVPTVVSVYLCAYMFAFGLLLTELVFRKCGCGLALFLRWLASIVTASLVVHLSPAASTASVSFLGI